MYDLFVKTTEEPPGLAYRRVISRLGLYLAEGLAGSSMQYSSIECAYLDILLSSPSLRRFVETGCMAHGGS